MQEFAGQRLCRLVATLTEMDDARDSFNSAPSFIAFEDC